MKTIMTLVALLSAGIVFAQGTVGSGAKEITVQTVAVPVPAPPSHAVSAPAQETKVSAPKPAAITIPEYQTREGVEKAARLVLSGRASVDLTGRVTVKTVTRQVGLSTAAVKAVARRAAEVARVNARNHGHAIGVEAVRKARLAAEEAQAGANSYTDAKARGLEPLISGAAAWGKWGVALAVLALIGLIAITVFLSRVFSRSRDCYDS